MNERKYYIKKLDRHPNGVVVMEISDWWKK
jgi:hypothetical protein